MYKHLEIWWVDLDPTRGSEAQKKRPCVIVQADIVNQRSNTLVVAPILPDHKTWPFVVNVTPTKANGLDKPRHINLKQLRVVDVKRIDNKNGRLERHYLTQIQSALQLVFGLPCC